MQRIISWHADYSSTPTLHRLVYVIDRSMECVNMFKDVHTQNYIKFLIDSISGNIYDVVSIGRHYI